MLDLELFASPPLSILLVHPACGGMGEVIPTRCRRNFLQTRRSRHEPGAQLAGPPFGQSGEVTGVVLWLVLRANGCKTPNLKAQHYTSEGGASSAR